MYHSLFAPLARRAAVLGGLAAVALSAAAATRGASKTSLRTLIVSGGYSLQNNEYAIESNARYVEGLTANARWRRIHFADGKRGSRTISTLPLAKDAREMAVLSWLLDREPESPARYELKASTLRQLDGPSTKRGVQQGLAAFVQGVKPGEHGLLYFTGHGSTGGARGLFGGWMDDTKNTTYALWNGGALSVRELARALQKPAGGPGWPAKVPLVLVMVQCHAGGFANVMYRDGVPGGPLWDRDFAGFFAAPGDRMSSGCTSQMDERNYQDFTTHFFAALSGRTRDGQPLTGADYDRNGAVSMNEAFAYASVHDRSIDVPVSTSGEYLYGLRFSLNLGAGGRGASYDQLMMDAQPWQRAILGGLTRELGLTARERDAAARGEEIHHAQSSDEDDDGSNAQITAADWTRYDRVHAALLKRFPRLRAAEDSRHRISAAQRAQAVRWLRARPADLAILDAAITRYYAYDNGPDVQEALLLRFTRMAETIRLQKRLQTVGTPAQKAAFARLRNAEGRNPLR